MADAPSVQDSVKKPKWWEYLIPYYNLTAINRYRKWKKAEKIDAGIRANNQSYVDWLNSEYQDQVQEKEADLSQYVYIAAGVTVVFIIILGVLWANMKK